MFKKGILIAGSVGLIAVILIALAGCGVGVPVRIDAEDNGSTVTLERGQTLVLTLESNPTTGYSWELGEFDEAVLELTSSVYVPYGHSSGKVGSGGEEIWYFWAQSPGGTMLYLEYLRAWEKGSEPAATFTVTVQVVVRPISSLLRFWERFRSSPAEPILVINYQRSGGFAGVDERWFIYSDGRVEGRDLTTGNVGTQAVADLLELIEEEGFFSFEERYFPQSLCCDRFTYRIVVFTEGKGKVVTAMDGADAPEGLWQIIGELNRLTFSVGRP